MKKRTKITISVFMLVIGIVCSMPAVTTMANTQLYTWGKTMTRGVWTFIRDKGVKKDTSYSVYLSYTGGSSYSDTLDATVYCSHTQGGMYERINYNGTLTPIYTLGYGQSVYMVNYVYETGRKYIKICGLASNTQTYSGQFQADVQ